MFQEERKVYVGVLIAVALMILIIGGFLYLALLYQRSRKRLNGQQVMAEIEGIEKDRKRIAADLHDEIGSLLTYIKLKAGNINAGEETGKEIKHIILQLNKMHDALLSITNNLLPNTLEQNGLMQAVEEFITEVGDELPMAIEYKVQQYDEDAIPADMKIHVYRIVKELVQNAVKHSQASKLSLELKYHKGILYILYSDNGKGFNLKKDLKNKNGLGIKNIHSRVDLVKGQVLIHTARNKGVQYQIEIPVP